MDKYSVQFKLPHRKITGTTSEQVSCDNPLAREVAMPLFDASVILAQLTTRKVYDSGPAHAEPHHEMFLMLQGEFVMEIGDKTYRLKPGMLAYIPPGTPCHRHNRGGANWWIYVKFADKPMWNPLRQHGQYVRAYESTDHFLLLLSRILDAHRTREIHAKLDALEDSRALADLLKRELRYVGKKPHERSDDLARVAAMVHSAPENPWTLKSMALEAHMAPRTLSRLFQQEYGVSPMNLVIHHRLNKAATILAETNDTIESVAEQAGYQSVYSFSNLFLQHFGVRPGQYREACLSGRGPGGVDTLEGRSGKAS